MRVSSFLLRSICVYRYVLEGMSENLGNTYDNVTDNMNIQDEEVKIFLD